MCAVCRMPAIYTLGVFSPSTVAVLVVHQVPASSLRLMSIPRFAGHLPPEARRKAGCRGSVTLVDVALYLLLYSLL